MKLQILTTAILVTPLCLATPLRAENPEHVRQLLQTKSCEGCDLSGADLTGADLSFAILVGADLRGANFTRANLSHADLSRANLSQTNFRQANLNQAYLTNTNLDRTNLVGASLSGTRGLPIMNPPIAQLPLPPRSLSRLSAISLPPLNVARPPRLSIPPLPRVETRLPQSSISASPALVARPPQSSISPLPALQAAPVLPRPVGEPQTVGPTQGTNTPPQQTANTYPPKVIASLMNSCAKEGNVRGVNMEPVCACLIKKIQNQYTLGEFLSMSMEMTESKKPPEKMMQIAVECAIESQAR